MNSLFETETFKMFAIGMGAVGAFHMFNTAPTSAVTIMVIAYIVSVFERNV